MSGGFAVEAKQDAILSAITALADYTDGEVLAEQSGADGVLTFTFSETVHLAVVESFGSGLVSRADPFGGTPTDTLGWPCRHEIPTFFPVGTAAVKVYAPTGTAINVIGYRR